MKSKCVPFRLHFGKLIVNRINQNNVVYQKHEKLLLNLKIINI